MAYAVQGDYALDYYPCRYGRSKILFRGPRRDLSFPFIAVLGGTETYGKHISMPYPALIEERTGLRMVNLGYPNAGIDLYLGEPEVARIMCTARVTVVMIMGAQNLSNRFYSVHPRRNDRFLKASSLLQTIYREVDFTEFHFTRHMLQTLQAVSPAKFAVMADELRWAWVARMSALLDQAGGKTVLVWLADDPPPAPGPADLSRDPLLIDRSMLTALRAKATAYVEVIPSSAALRDSPPDIGTGSFDSLPVRGLPGPAVHEELAVALGPVLERLYEAE